MAKKRVKSTKPKRASDSPLYDRVIASLGLLPRVEERRMFGGRTFMVDGKMCVSVGKERIMVRFDPALHDEVVKREGARTVAMKGRSYRGWVFVNESALTTKKQLDSWIALALDYNTRAKSSKESRRR